MKPVISQAQILEQVKQSLAEDLGDGDRTASLLPESQWVHAVILSREPMLVCGQDWVTHTFLSVDERTEIEWLVAEGTWLDQPSQLCRLHGVSRSVLTAERVALNFLQTLSGTATQTHQYVQRLKPFHTQLLDTRKTLPGLRLAQKYAVSCAGGLNHRLGLYDAYLIKENHIKACGSIKDAIKAARQQNDNLLVEVEVEQLDELKTALEANPDRILLDNFTIPMLYEAVAVTNNRCPLEASGGIDLSNLEAVAQTKVDFISVGSITKSVRAIDLSLLIQDV